MADDLSDLLDRDHVIARITALFVATDERDWETVARCFTREVLFDMASAGGGEARRATADHITDGWRNSLAALQAIHHQVGNFRVQVQGARATAACYGIAYHYLPNPTGRNTRVFVGTYDFELVRDDPTWRISRFRFNLKFVDGNPDLELAIA